MQKVLTFQTLQTGSITKIVLKWLKTYQMAKNPMVTRQDHPFFSQMGSVFLFSDYTANANCDLKASNETLGRINSSNHESL